MTAFNANDVETLAVVVVRDGRLPSGAEEAVAEADGAALLVGSGIGPESAAGVPGATRVWWAQAPLSASVLAATLAPQLEGVRLVILPASPDGRDLAPRLAARMGRALLAGAVRAAVTGGRAEADLLRVDGRVVVPVSTSSPAVATIWPGSRGPSVTSAAPVVQRLDLAAGGLGDTAGTGGPGGAGGAGGAGGPGGGLGGPGAPGGGSAVETLELVEPDPATMDLGDAPRVMAGGAGLVPEGASDAQATALFELLAAVAAALGASAGATRVVTDAGWMGYDRQIGTTGVTVQPELYVALGISGASQHVGGIGDPSRVVSVNLDASCPMTGLAELGLVADAPAVLVELAARLGVPVPPEVEEVAHR